MDRLFVDIEGKDGARDPVNEHPLLTFLSYARPCMSKKLQSANVRFCKNSYELIGGRTDNLPLKVLMLEAGVGL